MKVKTWFSGAFSAIVLQAGAVDCPTTTCLVKEGMTKEQVFAILGRADNKKPIPIPCTVLCPVGKTQETYRFTKHRERGIQVAFRDGAVFWAQEQVPVQMDPQEPLSKSEKVGRVLDGLVSAGTDAYMDYACPRVRRKPLLLLTNDDLELLQACKATRH